MPRRQTAGSAGYDLASARKVTLKPGVVTLVPTGLKVYLNPDEFLAVYIRSSLAVRKGLLLANSVGIIDHDYADNPDNEGHIKIPIYNPNAEAVIIEKGERVAQGIFQRFLLAGDDFGGGERLGGFGSTGVL